MKPTNYVCGDLFAAVESITDKSRCIIVPHVCNDAGAWGAGFVIPLGRKWPKVRNLYLEWHETQGLEKGDKPFCLGEIQTVYVVQQPLTLVCNMIAQHKTGGVRPLRYQHLAECMEKVGALASALPNCEIHAPAFGAGLAGGNWDFVHELIVDCWKRRDIPVTIYYLPGTFSPPETSGSGATG